MMMMMVVVVVVRLCIAHIIIKAPVGDYVIFLSRITDDIINIVV